MSNSDLRPRYATLRKNRLEKLVESLKTSLSSGEFYTREAFVSEAARALSRFNNSEDYDLVVTKGILPRAGSWPDSVKYNEFLTNVKDNLDIIFSEFETLEDFILSTFNYGVTAGERLSGRVKRVYSLVGDFSIYNDQDENIIVVRDSFSNADKIDLGVNLLAFDECNLSQEEGIITLPLDRDKSEAITVRATPRIDPRSNGVEGNNWQAGISDKRDDISVILDDNPDTWFEYERVSSLQTDAADPLILDLSLVLDEAKVINFIRVNPNNLGTRTALGIETIETSEDGKDFTSIKEDLLYVPYLAEDSDLQFTLAPATSKYAGQGLYTFLPRRTKYIHLIFSQKEPYTIQTTKGSRLRYAIGIRDIEIRSNIYKSKGEIISAGFEFAREISKVALRSTQQPDAMSSLASIKHYLSCDNGSSWNEIRSLDDDGAAGKVSEVPEILNFNNGAIDSLVTVNPAFSLRWRAVLERNDQAFDEGRAILHETIDTITESHDPPKTAPHQVKLDYIPVEDSVHVIEPRYGCRGKARDPYKVGIGGEQETFVLPKWQGINEARPWVKEVLVGDLYDTVAAVDADWIHVSVGGHDWPAATLPVASYGPNDQAYWIDWNDYTLRFGDGIAHGVKPTTGDRIDLYFDAERIFPIGGSLFPAKLMFPHVLDKDSVKIKFYGTDTNGSTTVPKNEKTIKFDHQNIVSISTALGGTEKDFINGSDELSGAGEWSVNYEKGILYLYTPSDTLTVVEYVYNPVVELSSSDWEWGTTETVSDSVKIRPSGWYTNEAVFALTGLTVPANNRYCLHLPHFCILQKSVKVVSTYSSGSNPFVEEVPFINGAIELKSVPTDRGLYSIDYAKGRIFTQRTLQYVTALTATYEYADYRAEYSISRQISPSDFTVDYSTGLITFRGSALVDAEGVADSSDKKLQVSYDYIEPPKEKVVELKEYYTPIVRDYLLRILPKEA